MSSSIMQTSGIYDDISQRTDRSWNLRFNLFGIRASQVDKVVSHECADTPGYSPRRRGLCSGQCVCDWVGSGHFERSSVKRRG